MDPASVKASGVLKGGDFILFSLLLIMVVVIGLEEEMDGAAFV